ncbi:MAG: MFS transporter [Desulfobacterales bacterium]|nr:MAG: MFS transporter [Desulfobacterales bacterium]
MDSAKRITDLGKFYYGWMIVAVALVSLAFWFGIRSSFSVFYVALLEDFPWNRGDSAGVQSMALITYTLMAPVVGGLIDRFGPRRIIIPGIFVLTLGLILCATIESLTQFYLLYGVVVGAGVTCIGIISYSAILAHWFEKKRGLASGIAVSGMGLGVFFWVPVCQHLISVWGWRPTFVILGGLFLIVLLPLNALFLRHKPEELGQLPDGVKGMNPDGAHAPPPAALHRRPEDTGRLVQVLSSGRFWALMAFPFLIVIGVYIVLVHNVKFLVDQGIDKMTAALIFALAGVVSSLFRIFWGWLSDRIGRESTYTIGVVFGGLGVGSLMLLETTGAKIFVYPFFIFFGMGWGVTAPMFLSVSADLFQGQTYGFIYGLVEAGIGVAGAIGAWVAGFIFDRTQSYHLAWILVLIVFLSSCLFVWLAAPRKHRPV